MLRCERRGASLPGAAEPQHRGRGRLSGLGEGCCGCGGGRDRPPAAGTGRGSPGAAAAWRYPGGPSGRGGRGGGGGGGGSSSGSSGSPTPRGTRALPSAASVAVSREPSGMRGLSPPELRLEEAAPPAPSVRAHRLPAARDQACYGALERPFVAVGRRPAARRHAPSTYCSTMVQHCEALGRAVQVVNLDPAAEQFSYPVMADIRELIEVDDVMEDESLRFGPNGGLVFCMEYFANNFNWLEESLGHVEDDYILFDCPGQIELYTHLPVMKQLVEQLQQWEFRVCGVFLVDSQFMVESFKFISGILAALSAMISLEIPQINIMTKMDLLSKKAKKEIEKYLDPDMYSMIEDSTNILKSKMFKKLTKSICGLIDDYGMVRFLPFDRSDEESINIVLQHIDFTIQYGEDLEFKEPKECEEDKSALVDEYFQDHVDE
ncbi:GPN-loop GTPase 3 isoform X1 [Phalacrocorax aristotelis]|uniref:GPN-loop GTPase 3 isoform X1 n=1 Tax=Phalacrocorax aristotelis TaxID=126867 RepID=UPI003F4BC574